GTGLLLGASLLDPRGEAVGERISGGSAPRVDRPSTLAVLRRLEIELAGDFDDLAVDADGAGGRVDLGNGEGGQLAPAQAAVGGRVGQQLVEVSTSTGGERKAEFGDVSVRRDLGRIDP